MVLHLATAKSAQIATWKKVPGDVKLNMSAVLIEAAEKKYTKKKRESDAFEAVDGLVSAAAANFVTKRSRPSASTGESAQLKTGPYNT